MAGRFGVDFTEQSEELLGLFRKVLARKLLARVRLARERLGKGMAC